MNNLNRQKRKTVTATPSEANQNIMSSLVSSVPQGNPQ